MLIFSIKYKKNRYKFKDIVIFEAGGLSTMYADDGGIIFCY